MVNGRGQRGAWKRVSMVNGERDCSNWESGCGESSRVSALNEGSNSDGWRRASVIGSSCWEGFHASCSLLMHASLPSPTPSLHCRHAPLLPVPSARAPRPSPASCAAEREPSSGRHWQTPSCRDRACARLAAGEGRLRVFYTVLVLVSDGHALLDAVRGAGHCIVVATRTVCNAYLASCCYCVGSIVWIAGVLGTAGD